MISWNAIYVTVYGGLGSVLAVILDGGVLWGVLVGTFLGAGLTMMLVDLSEKRRG